MNSLLLSFCVNDAQLIAGSTGDVKGDWGCFPNEHAEAFVWTQTLLAQLVMNGMKTVLIKITESSMDRAS